jgi:thiamine pyrophosphate-dependent acetolactate synthase large subunit-like protein
VRQAGHCGEAAVKYRPIDFADVARAMGLDGHTAQSAGDVDRLLRDGWDRPRLIDARIDPAPYGDLIRHTRG